MIWKLKMISIIHCIILHINRIHVKKNIVHIDHLVKLIDEGYFVSIYPYISSDFSISKLFNEICDKAEQKEWVTYKNNLPFPRYYIKMSVGNHIIIYRNTDHEFRKDD